MTVGGELLDFEAAFERMRSEFEGPYFVVTKSFGAVSTCVSLDRYREDIEGVVLWNPVLDIDGTFLEPRSRWGVENFTGEKLETLHERGYIGLDSGFRFGRVLYEELHRYDPGARFRESSIPALVVHGDADGIVPYDDARRVARAKGATFHTVENADHGFVKADGDPPDGRREHDGRTVDWLRSHVGT